ncbi:uncharacterized protein BXZ73DRAFT_97118 [Epithele typhae]|uniref:uncharacterized protein n=1 Tax=Epithele typhae TaxID=378194 RepID=UPI002008CBBD|nr:uncharacterized protein BXZ73DRAFT_97118 [Epithele typhae]KAH9943057.1 hypothetical protein BXZ73DRAFT_97118 [Epithele typhae]
MYTSGGPGESGTKEVAVIGQADTDGITAILLSRNASSTEAAKSSAPTRILGSSERGYEILKTSTVPQMDFSNFDSYAEDATSVIQFFCSKDRSGPDRIYIALVFAFIITRCYHKLLARVENGDKIWGGSKGTEYDHPTSYIRRAFDSKSPSSITEQHFVLGLPPYIEILLSEWGIEPSSCTDQTVDSTAPGASTIPGSSAAQNASTRHFKVSADNAKQWAEALHGIVHKVRTFLREMVEKKKSSYEILEFLQLEYYMVLLQALLRCGVVSHLITGNIEIALSKMRDHNLKRFVLKAIITKPDTTGKPSIDPHEEENSSRGNPTSTEHVGYDDDEDLAADASTEPGETEKSHVIRYLKTLLIPLTIILTLQRLRNARPTSVTVYRFLSSASSLSPTSSSGLFNEVLRAAHESDLDVSKDSDLFKLSTSKKTKHSAVIHTEAALMTLVWSLRANPSTAKAVLGEAFEDLQDMLREGEILIGISKKCCYCCHLLAEELASNGSPSPVKFVLQGTHATVYPWLPPDGLPLKVLQGIRAKLKEALMQAIRDELSSTGSAQSSPFSTTSELAFLPPQETRENFVNFMLGTN